MPVCKSCNKDLNFSEFYVHTKDKSGQPIRYMSKCKKCYSAQSYDHYRTKKAHYNNLQREYRKNNKDKFKAWRLKRNWNLSVEEFESMLSAQDSRCFICSSTFADTKGKRPNVDHCHNTGKVRKLLCTRCNTTLGLIDEDIRVLSSMIDYISGEKF